MLGHFAALFSGSAGSNPGYGFHTDYTQDQQYPGGRAANNTGGGFWTGMGTGGLLGYMFGRQRSAQRSTWRVGDVMLCLYSLLVMDVCASYHVTGTNLLGATATIATLATLPIMLRERPHRQELGLHQVYVS